jgi:hypothetical protein
MNGMSVCTRLRDFAQAGGRIGCVHSVFDHAVNMLFDERMISVLSEPRSLVPYGCTVSCGNPFPAYGIKPGMPAALNTASLSAGALQLDFSEAVPVELDMDRIPLTGNADDILSGAETILKTLRETGDSEGLSPLVSGCGSNLYVRFIAPRLEILYNAVAAGGGDAAVDAAEACAGCGIGLTPSSDDLLTGYMAGVRLLCRMGRMTDVTAYLPAMAQAAAQRTNRISGTFLTECATGLVSKDFLSLLSCIFTGAAECAVSEAAKRVASFGSTSGRDMLTGLVLAIQHHNGGKNSG